MVVGFAHEQANILVWLVIALYIALVHLLPLADILNVVDGRRPPARVRQGPQVGHLGGHGIEAIDRNPAPWQRNVAAVRIVDRAETLARREDSLPHVDRKSTRLNSSHANISYAVFCL